MNIFHRLSIASILLPGILFLLTGCKDPAPATPAEEAVTNGFVYNGNEYSIGSVVRFDQDNNTTQFWISPEEGLVTVDEIEARGGHLILSTHMSYLGARDRFSKAGSFARFGNMQYAYGDEGMGYIETSLNGEEITILFAVESMTTRSEDETDAILKGSYKGTYATFSDTPLSNEWSSDRKRGAIASAKIIIREDGKADTYILNDNTGRSILEFKLPQYRRGLPTILSTDGKNPEEMSVTFADGSKADMTKVFGSVTANFDEGQTRISFDITSDGTRTRAEYEGPYSTEIIKANRYHYDSGYPYGSGYDGTFLLTDLKTVETPGKIVFKLIPYDTDERFADIPELTLTDLSLIGKEDIDMRNTPGWHFEFDKISVDCYENEWKPAPSAGSKLTILTTENGYLIDMEMSTEEPTFKYISTIDLHYEGPASRQ